MRLFCLRWSLIRQEVILPFYVLKTRFYIHHYACVVARSAVNIQHSTSCVIACFPGMMSSLAKSKQIIGAHFQTLFFLKFSYWPPILIDRPIYICAL